MWKLYCRLPQSREQTNLFKLQEFDMTNPSFYLHLQTVISLHCYHNSVLNDELVLGGFGEQFGDRFRRVISAIKKPRRIRFHY